jgi:hypothetical protein
MLDGGRQIEAKSDPAGESAQRVETRPKDFAYLFAALRFEMQLECQMIPTRGPHRCDRSPKILGGTPIVVNWPSASLRVMPKGLV